ncbi:MAG TPA: M15 family metallopeptidase [Ignavibacteria bacterium]|nr:M15 family metallopeptidase [Ignavibacteria bacterium]
MTLRKQQSIFTFNVHKLIEFAFKLGFELTFGEVYRTAEQQKIYFDSGRSKTMNSMHLQRLAVDFNFFFNGELINDPKHLKKFGDYWKLLNTSNRWGGDFKTLSDPYHFEQSIK